MKKKIRCARCGDIIEGTPAIIRGCFVCHKTKHDEKRTKRCYEMIAFDNMKRSEEGLSIPKHLKLLERTKRYFYLY